MAVVRMRKPVEYLHEVTSNAVTYGKKSEPVLDLTEAVRVQPHEWAWVAAIAFAAIYLAGCFVHTTITIVQWAAS